MCLWLLTFPDDKLAAIPLFSIVLLPAAACPDCQPSTSYWRAAVQTCGLLVLLVVHMSWAGHQHTWDGTPLYNLQRMHLISAKQDFLKITTFL